jgi:predicted  nucleic acid-binding Zn-ribbon protein
MGQLATALAELHRIHRQLADLRDRMDRGPKQVKAAEANVAKAEQDHQAAKDAYKQAKIGADQKQLQLREREAKLLDWQGKLMQAQSNREYQALKDQIAADQQANSVLADEILEALEKLDTLTAAIKTAAGNLATLQAEADKIHKRVADQTAMLQGEFARVEGELVTAEKVLPEEFKAELQRIAKARGEDAMANVEGDCCGGCYQTLTPQTIELLRQDKLLFCKSCGRLLYMAG